MADVLENLATLDKATLREVAARANFLLGDTGLMSDSPSQDAGIFFDRLQEHFRGRGSRIMPYNVLRSNRTLGKAFNEASKSVQELIGQHLKPKRRAALFRCYDLIIDAASLNVRRSKAPFGVKTLLFELRDAYAAVDRQFPGYLRAGLLRHILSARR